MRYILTILIVIISFNLAFNQQTIKGIIYDNQKNPLIGSTVTIKGSSIGTITDSNGSFSINAKVGDILVVTFSGYEAIEREIQDYDFKNEIKLYIEESTSLEFIDSWTKELKTKIDSINKSCQLERKRIIDNALINVNDDDDDKIKMRNDIEKLERRCEESIDKLYKLYFSIPGYFRNVFPITNLEHAIEYYGNYNQLDFLDENNLGFGRNNSHFSNKLVTVYGGIFQFSFSSNLTKANSVKLDLEKIKNFDRVQLDSYLFELDSLNRANSTLMKIASGGGEASFNAKTAVLNFGMKDESSRFKFQTEIYGRFSFDVPLADSYIESKDWSIFGSIGLLNMAVYNFTSSDGKASPLSIFGTYSPTLVHGSKKFYSNAYFESTNPFLMHDYAIGLRYDYIDLFFTMQSFSKNNNPDDGLSGRVGFKFNNLFQKK